MGTTVHRIFIPFGEQLFQHCNLPILVHQFEDCKSLGIHAEWEKGIKPEKLT